MKTTNKFVYNNRGEAIQRIQLDDNGNKVVKLYGEWVPVEEWYQSQYSMWSLSVANGNVVKVGDTVAYDDGRVSLHHKITQPLRMDTEGRVSIQQTRIFASRLYKV